MCGAWINTITACLLFFFFKLENVPLVVGSTSSLFCLHNNLKCIHLAAPKVCRFEGLWQQLRLLDHPLPCVLWSKMPSYYWQRDSVSLWLVP